VSICPSSAAGLLADEPSLTTRPRSRDHRNVPFARTSGRRSIPSPRGRASHGYRQREMVQRRQRLRLHST
jgi:hypothetical protein